MIWIIGVGNIGREYAKVLKALGKEFIAIGRGESRASSFEAETSHEAIRGGLSAFLKTGPELPDAAIVAVGVEVLASATEELLNYGVKRILLEKPGVGLINEIDSLTAKTKQCGADVMLAYNRRFYSSVLKAEEIIKADGGVSSFNFEFTEWVHTFDIQSINPVSLSTWLLANSSHVLDTAFFLGGQPTELSAYRSGGLNWHPQGSVFAGAGVSESGALFSYQANWQAPGRWVVEILTPKHRLYFKPMESLQVQDLGSVAVNPVELDNRLDVEFKPGFYLQTKTFLAGDYSRFCSIADQKSHIDHYYLKISGYKR